MKRVAFYRRPGVKDSPLSGMKERVIWRLSKGPQTGTQLAEIFSISRVQMNILMGSVVRFNSVACVTASEWFHLPGGGRDRTYTLERKPKMLAKPGKAPRKTPRALCYTSEETKRINTEKAKRRARLIAAGLYIPEFD